MILESMIDSPFLYLSKREVMLDYLEGLLQIGVSKEKEILINKALNVVNKHNPSAVSELLDPVLYQFCKELRTYTDSYFQ